LVINQDDVAEKNYLPHNFVGQTPPNQVTNEPTAQKKYSEHPLKLPSNS